MEKFHPVLTVIPSGKLVLRYEFIDSEQVIHDNTVSDAFVLGASEGLLSLAAATDVRAWPAPLHFWRQFAVAYLTLLCKQVSSDATTSISPLTPHEFEHILLNLPPMPGAEYCTVQTLHDLWLDFDLWVHNTLGHYETGLSGFLAAHLPEWHQVGRVCFHLAENKQDPDYPFAFMVTYAPSLGKNARIQYLPLSHALKTYANDKERLLILLKPIYEASARCDWVEELLTSQDIYHPLAWTPQEAYAFLNSVSQLEESGLLVRLPNWWKKRVRARVQVSIGNVQQKKFDANALLDFKLDVAVDGANLTPSELHEILSSDEKLIFLHGQWVEVDKKKLNEALEHWKMIQEEVGSDGLTYIEGMRLLSGSDKDLKTADFNFDENDTWAYVNAGPWLRDLLFKLRQPETIKKRGSTNLLGATLRPYQIIGVHWLDFLTELGLGACLADDMGLGKTLQVIALLLIKKQQTTIRSRPSIIVMPASLLSNWKGELEKFAPSLKVLYLHLSELGQARMEGIVSNGSVIQEYDIVLTTYGMMLRHSWLTEIEWNLVILDEAQAIKNPTAKQTKVIKCLQGSAKIALTGTPIENRLGDLWSLFDFLSPGLLGSVSRFKQYVEQVTKNENQSFAPLRKLIQPYILRRLKTDKQVISDLPDKTELVAWCGLSKKQAILYTQAVAELRTALESETGIKRKGLVLAYLMRFKKICNHVAHAMGDGEFDKNNSGKFIRLAELCEEIASRQEKVLIFTQFREMTAPIADFLSPFFKRLGLVLHGSTPVKQRKHLVEQFQSQSGPPFFVLSLKTAGIGLNLTAANHVIHFDRWWNPSVENQATDRAFRIGQKRNVMVHKLVCRGTIEEKINHMISEKMKLASDILAGGAETLLTELDDNAIVDLVSLDLDKSFY